MSSPLDNHGQPLNRFLNRDGRISRAVDELIGFLKGVIADDVVSTVEVVRLGEWVLMNREVLGYWPVSVLAHRLNRIFEDGHVDEEERAELRGFIYELLGSNAEDVFVNRATKLPLTKPYPEIVFDGEVFVFTGRFLYGTRKRCQEAVVERGGQCTSNVTLKSNYLIIGDLGSEDWKHSTHGTKILKAVQMVPFSGINIVSEQHWAGYLLPALEFKTESACPFCSRMISVEALKCRYCDEFLTGAKSARA
jgi:BRCA1 C Terminus (BRCT) domain